MEVLLLRHRWIQGLPQLHSRWRPDCEQDLHDSGRRRELPVEALSGSLTSQDLVLLKVFGDAETFDTPVDSLPQVRGVAPTTKIHPLIQQRQ